MYIKVSIAVKIGLEPITHVCVALQADPVLNHHRATTLFSASDRGVYQFHHLTNLPTMRLLVSSHIGYFLFEKPDGHPR